MSLPCRNVCCKCCSQVLGLKNGRSFLILEAELELGGTVDQRLLREDFGISISIMCCPFIWYLYAQTFIIETYEGISHSDESWINIDPEHQPFLNTNP